VTHVQPRALIFDLDDTLIDTTAVFRRLRLEFVDLLAGEGFARDAVLPAYELVDTKNLEHLGYVSERNLISMREAYENLAASEGRICSAAVLRRIASIGGHCLYRIPRPMRNMRPVLRWCSQRYKLVLVTRGSQALQGAKVDSLRLAEYFDFVEVVPRKNVATFEGLLTRLKFAPAEIVSIGDSLPFDILPALAAGMAAIHVQYHSAALQWRHDWAAPDELSEHQYGRAEDLLGVRKYLARL
jgi:putative hydrolase of the HAD superfamily